MALSYARGLGTPLSLGQLGPLLGSRSWVDPARPFLYPPYVARRGFMGRKAGDIADLVSPQPCCQCAGFSGKEQRRKGMQSVRLRAMKRASEDQRQGAMQGNEGDLEPRTSIPLWKSLLGVTAGLALCTSLHVGQAHALELDQLGVATETSLAAETLLERRSDLSEVPLDSDATLLSPVTPVQFTVDSPEGTNAPAVLVSGEAPNPVLDISAESGAGRKSDGSEGAPGERKRRTSNGIAAAAAAVAGVSLVASGGSTAAAAGATTAAVASAGGVAAGGAAGGALLAASTVPVSHAVATAATLHAAEAVGATVAASALAGGTAAAASGAAAPAVMSAAVGAGAVAAGTTSAVIAAGLASAAAGSAGAASAVTGATSAVAGATSAAMGAASAVAGAAPAVTSAVAGAVAGATPAVTSAVAGATSAIASSAVAGAASAAAGATSAVAATTSVVTSAAAATASAAAGAAASAAVPSSAFLATSLPAAVASKAVVASSAGAISSTVASAVPAVVAKSGASAAATSALTSAGAVCTTPVRAVAHAATSAVLEGGAAAAAAAESAAVAHSAAVLTQSGLASAIASSAHHFVEGGVAGAVGATVVCPIDVVKTRMQGQETKKGEKPKYANPADCVVQILKEEGPGAFFLGIIPQLLGVAPEKAMKLTVNDLLMSVLEGYIPGARLWTLELFAGSGGGLAQVVFTNPMEMVKIRQQMQGPADPGHAKKTALEIARELGPAGLYQGSIATLLREIPSSAIFFGCYIVLKDSFPDQPFIAGCLAAAPSAFLCTPMDVVKTRMQMERKEGETVLGFWDTTQKIIREEGPKALFNGGLTRVLRVSPQFGITLAVYELLNHW